VSAFGCMYVCLNSLKQQMAWTINTKLVAHILYDSCSAGI